MSVFNAFYLKFSSNAEDVIKGNKAVEKSTKDTERSLKTTNDTTKEIGQNFVKMAEAVAGAIGAISGFEFLKAGVQNAIEYNTQLKLMAENAGMTAEQLRKVGIATHLAGGTEQMGLQDASAMARIKQKQGVTGEDPFTWIRQLRSQLSTMSSTQQHTYASGVLGVSPAMERMITSGGRTDMTDTEFNDVILKRSQRLSAGTNAAADSAYAANQSEIGLSTETQDFFNRLLGDVSPWLQKIFDKISNIVGGTSAGVGASAIVAGETAKNIGIVYLASKFLPKSGASAAKLATSGLDAAGVEATAGAGIGTIGLAGSAALAGGIAAGYGIVSIFQDQIEKILVRIMTSDIKTPSPLARSLQNKSSLDPTTEWQNAVNDPAHKAAVEASGRQWDRINASKHITNAKNILATAAAMTPPSRGDMSVNIEKVEVHTQATDAAGIATGISGALEEKIYTMLNFVASQSDNGVSK